MREVNILRNASTSKQTTGTLYYQFLGDQFQCDTLELADKNNAPNVSCIPLGEYVCKWTRSNRLSKLKGTDVYTYEVLDVPNRTGIRIHSASFFYDLLGCISLGEGFIDMDGDKELDLINSRATIKRFNELLDGNDFKLIIKLQPLSV